MKVWIEAMRLRTLPLSASGVIIAAGLAAHWSCFRVSVFMPMLIMVILLQIIANFADEYGDLANGADNDDRIGPVRGMQRGEISRAQMKRALIVTCILAAISMALLFFTSGLFSRWQVLIVFIVLGALCVWGAIRYTVGKGAYGYRALGDLFCFIFFGLLAVAGGFYLYSLDLIGIAFLPAVGLGCFIVGFLNLNNMRDRTTDMAAGKKTVAVYLGARGSLVYHALLFAVGIACFFTFNISAGIFGPLRWLYILLFAPLVVQVVQTVQAGDPSRYDSFMKPLSMTIAALALAFALCIGL